MAIGVMDTRSYPIATFIHRSGSETQLPKLMHARTMSAGRIRVIISTILIASRSISECQIFTSIYGEYNIQSICAQWLYANNPCSISIHESFFRAGRSPSHWIFIVVGKGENPLWSAVIYFTIPPGPLSLCK